MFGGKKVAVTDKHQILPITLKTAILNPNMRGKTVLVEDKWDYIRYHIKTLPRGQKEKANKALFFWDQAEEFYKSSEGLSKISAPLPLYYSFLNATKAFLYLKSTEPVDEYHGISGKNVVSQKIMLSSQIVSTKSKGVCPSLAQILGDTINCGNEYNLDDLLFNLVFVHRAYSISHKLKKSDELFIPLDEIQFRRKPDKRITIVSKIDDKYRDRKVIENISTRKFEIDNRDNPALYFSWQRGPKLTDLRKINSEEIKKFHSTARRHFQEIAAGIESRWYLKNYDNPHAIDLNPLVIIYMIMHRLSEMSRYQPDILQSYFMSEHSWILTEFITSAPFQFINGISSEMTGEQFGIPRNPRLHL